MKGVIMDTVINVPVLIACLIALVIAIIANNKLKMHLGVICLFFAFVIGIGMQGMSSNELLSGAPANIILIFLFAVPFFTAISQTGALQVLAKKLIRATKGKTGILPVAIILAIALISCCAEATVMYVLGPLVVTICLITGMDLILACMLFAFAIPIGSANPFTTLTGQVIMGITQSSGAADPFKLETAVWLNMILNSIILIVITMLIFKGFKLKKAEIDEDENLEFTRDQKVAVRLFIVALILLVCPSVFAVIFPKAAVFTWLKGVLNVYSVYTLMTILAFLLKIAKFNDTVKKVPWTVLATLVGVMLLIDVATAAGLGTLLSDIISSNVPVFLIPAILILCSALFSFVATFFAVFPLLVPVAAAISANTGLSLAMLVSCICIGAIGSGSTSPLSAMGAQILSVMPAEEQPSLSSRMIRYTFVTIAVYFVLALIGVYKIIPGLLGV